MRGSLRYTPREDLSADFIVTWDRQRNPGTAFVSKALPTASGPGNPFGAAHLGGSPLSASVLGKKELGLDRDVYDLNLTVNASLNDRWTLTTVNGYRRFDSLEVFDADGSAAWYLKFAELAQGTQGSHETRFAYSGERLRASLGWNLFREYGIQNVPFSSEEGIFLQCVARLIPNLPCISPNGAVSAAITTGLLTGGRFQSLPYRSVFENQGKNDSYSIFADATWSLNERLDVTADANSQREARVGDVVGARCEQLLAQNTIRFTSKPSQQTAHTPTVPQNRQAGTGCAGGNVTCWVRTGVGAALVCGELDRRGCGYAGETTLLEWNWCWGLSSSRSLRCLR
jgi:outer membrane receptor protein involved in Fe transport